MPRGGGGREGRGRPVSAPKTAELPDRQLQIQLDVKLSWFIFGTWQVVLMATVVGVAAGYAQAVEWGETPVFVDPLAQVGLILVTIIFLAPILRTTGPMYVTV